MGCWVLTHRTENRSEGRSFGFQKSIMNQIREKAFLSLPFNLLADCRSSSKMYELPWLLVVCKGGIKGLCGRGNG